MAGQCITPSKMHKKLVRANAQINSTIAALITTLADALILNTEITSREWSNGKNTVAARR